MDGTQTQAHRIPFNRVACLGRERDYLADAVASGRIGGGGPYSARVRATLERALGVPLALPTTSCSDALEMASVLLGIGPGDEVVVPSFAFVTVAGAFALRGARIVFADVRPDTLCLDEERLAERIGPRTRAVVALHYGGVACEMDAVLGLAARHGLAVVEDLAHGPFASYRGRPLGSFGALACLSFHETKNFSCGEGGALLVNDPALARRAEIVHEKGTDRTRFLAGAVDKYSWRDLGGSYGLSDLQAAFLLGQLEQRETVRDRRARLWRRYDAGLAAWAEAHGVARPAVPAHSGPPDHLYFLVMPSAADRDGLIEHLGRRGILAVFHYVPLHLSEMGRRYGGRPGDCPQAERAGARLLRLPFFTTLSDAEQDEVIDAVTDYVPRPAGSGRCGAD
ncbi:dTDP-4-amino-4,6-dideoxygalactose transaminase [Tistlia consotensis]|uniref:dTDP-4-amino-4,6-dideoxygalactose transaminase n=1 Tax=Tistlia consotensis USBA 355 TaxID=560819 RepID=A0A1Y6CKM8_9PROT|nr:dTDP-4-amino-4,6-dideoxygalactose transaminase [Tistlia consotensis]SMF71453.1 dTDP-4-amino-4,6-dideoxygalactose transaminase [Tistlia consotensis USBA 355]SNS06646.1 dTDP-4-amino-4,6-dideoxygalactose transaminase [Tistlia consotensis]